MTLRLILDWTIVLVLLAQTTNASPLSMEHKLRIQRNFVSEEGASQLFEIITEVSCPYPKDAIADGLLSINGHGGIAYDFPTDEDKITAFRDIVDGRTNGQVSGILRLQLVKDVARKHVRSIVNNTIENSVIEDGGTIHLYLSRPEASALANHTDVTDIFVLQLSGAKEWILCDADAPQFAHELHRNLRGKLDLCTTYNSVEMDSLRCERTTLYPGDALYLPKHVIHSAQATPDGLSAHLTFGFAENTCSADTMENCIAAQPHAEHRDLQQRRLLCNAAQGGSQCFTACNSNCNGSCDGQPCFSGCNGPTPSPTPGPTPRPSATPSERPSSNPSANPSSEPSMKPSQNPSSVPSREPSTRPSNKPSIQGSLGPTSEPSARPTNIPSVSPSLVPSATPSEVPSVVPSEVPSDVPSTKPSSQPSLGPTIQPSVNPTFAPVIGPTPPPTPGPTGVPTLAISAQPSTEPSKLPTRLPSVQPSRRPSITPFVGQTPEPTVVDSSSPSVAPTETPTEKPAVGDVVEEVSSEPSTKPSMELYFSVPSLKPTDVMDDLSGISSEAGLASSAIYGIVGAVALLIGLCFLFFFFRKRKKQVAKTTVDVKQHEDGTIKVTKTTEYRGNHASDIERLEFPNEATANANGYFINPEDRQQTGIVAMNNLRVESIEQAPAKKEPELQVGAGRDEIPIAAAIVADDDGQTPIAEIGLSGTGALVQNAAAGEEDDILTGMKKRNDTKRGKVGGAMSAEDTKKSIRRKRAGKLGKQSDEQTKRSARQERNGAREGDRHAKRAARLSTLASSAPGAFSSNDEHKSTSKSHKSRRKTRDGDRAARKERDYDKERAARQSKRDDGDDRAARKAREYDRQRVVRKYVLREGEGDGDRTSRKAREHDKERATQKPRARSIDGNEKKRARHRRATPTRSKSGDVGDPRKSSRDADPRSPAKSEDGKSSKTKDSKTPRSESS
ncbi:MAG: hypothetical protein SGBAC_011855 [Bacillariaceae sp.]